MKSVQSTSSILLALSIILLAGCKSVETPSNSAANSAQVTSSNSRSADNSNQSAQTASANRDGNPSKEGRASANAKPNSPPQLIGAYESREVQSEGVVTLMSKLKTLFRFRADGTYARESQVKGKVYHADSGTFRIEAPNKLILTIQITGLKMQRKVQSPPATKTHIFSLSSDGDELKLTSDKGKTAIFRRVSKTKTS